MNYIEIPNKGEFPVPSDWDELSQKQVDSIFKMLVKLNNGIIDFDAFIVKAFYLIAGIKRNWLSVYKEKLRSKYKNREKQANTYMLAEFYTKFLFKQNEQNQTTAELYYNTVKNFFPQVKVRETIFHGPKDFLMDLTFGEFRRVVDALNQLQKDKSEQKLNSFFVLPYRPNRNPLQTADLNGLSLLAQKIPQHIKLASLLWFSTCVSYITTADIDIDGRLVNFSPLFPKPENSEEKKKDNSLGWLSVLFAIAKDGLFGTTNNIDERKFYDVLLYMLDNHQQNIRLKLSQKK